MNAPNFLRIVSIPRQEQVKLNETAIVLRTVFDNIDDSLTNILSQKLGFSYKLVAPPDKGYGKLLLNGSWTGMVGMIQRKEADMILYNLVVTDERLQVLDFSNPYYIDETVFVTKKLERLANKAAFLEPFSMAVWWFILACVLLLPVVHYFLFKTSHSFRYLCFGKFFDHFEDSISVGEHILRTSWMVGELFLCWCFTAVLLSFLTFPSLHGVRTISELAAAVKQGKYECIVLPGSFLIHALESAGGDSAIIGENLNKSNKNTFQYEEALSKNNSSLKLAFIAAARHLYKLKQNYFVSHDSFFPSLISAGFKKDFCCRDKFNSMINKIWDSGLYLKLLQNHWYKETYRIYQKSLNKDAKSKEIQLSLEDVSGMFLILAVGYTLASIVFILEVIYGNAGASK